MLLEIVVLSFVIAFLRGGRFNQFPRFNKIPLLFGSVALQLGSALVTDLSGYLISLAYMLTIVFFWFNREHLDIKFFSVGWLLNAIVIWANQGKMPIDLIQASKLPYSLEKVINGTDFKHSMLTQASHFPYLADIIYMPYVFPRVISVGDIFIMIGTFLLVQRLANKTICFSLPGKQIKTAP